MRLVSVILLFCIFLNGCGSTNTQIEPVMDLRKRILDSSTCSFSAVITADYGDEVYTFQMDCESDNSRTMVFTVTYPETIAGITGQISDNNANLTFDDKVLAFPMLVNEQLAPVIAPWIFLNTLYSGYLSGYSQEQTGICLYFDDSFEGELLQLLVYTDELLTPIRAEIVYNERRILTLDINNFIFK